MILKVGFEAVKLPVPPMEPLKNTNRSAFHSARANERRSWRSRAAAGDIQALSRRFGVSTPNPHSRNRGSHSRRISLRT